MRLENNFWGKKIYRAAKMLFPNIKVGNYLRAKIHFKNKKRLRSLQAAACSSRLDLKGIQFSHYSLEDRGGLLQIIDLELNRQNGQCEYLLRDSFGAQCELYQKHLSCNKGYIWVNEKFIRKNVFEVEFAKRKITFNPI